MTRTRDESGFTLVELLVGIVITAIITAAISASIVVGLRTADGAADRLDESHDAQLVPTYLVADLQSAYPDDISTSGVNTGCAAPAATGTHVLSLKWTESLTVSGPTQVFRSSYWLDTGPEGGELVRYSCVQGSTPLRLKLTRNLTAGSPSVTINGPRVTLRFIEASGFAYSVSGIARTPGTVPVVPLGCGVNTAVAAPNPATRASGGPATALSPVQVTVDTYGSCNALKVTYQPDGVSTQATNLTPNAGKTQWTTSLSGGAWTDGNKPLVVADGAGPTLSTINLGVGQTCGLSATTAPTTVLREPGGSSTNLTTGFTINAPSSGACTALTATFNPNGSGNQSVPLTETAPGVWSATVARDAYTWSGGAKTITVSDTSGASATTTLTVTNGCAAVLTLTPAAVQRQPGAAPNGLGQNVTATASPLANCSGLQIRFTPNGSAVTLALNASGSVVIARNAYAWTDGAKTFTLTNGTVDYGVATLVVSAGCSVSQLVTSPSSVGRGNGNNANRLAANVTVSLLPGSSCGSPVVLKLTYDTGFPASANESVDFAKPNNQTQYEAVILKNDDEWTTGKHTLTVRDANGDVVATTEVTVT